MLELEVELVPQGNPVGADRRQLGLQRRTGGVHSADAQRAETEAAALVEAERVEVVVRRREPDDRAAGVTRSAIAASSSRVPIPLRSGEASIETISHREPSAR